MSGPRRLLMGGGGTATFPFGDITMLREFWAEDPAWTNPGDGNTIVTFAPDNGSLGMNLSTANGTGVKYRSTAAPHGRPSWDFALTSSGFQTTSGATSGKFSVITIASSDTTGTGETVTDAGTTNNAFTQFGVSGYRMYNNGGACDLTAGTYSADTTYVIVSVFETNNFRIYSNGSLIGTDATGTLGVATGLTLGANYVFTGNYYDGHMSYVAMYAGDFTLASGYSDWLNAAEAYYGIT